MGKGGVGKDGLAKKGGFKAFGEPPSPPKSPSSGVATPPAPGGKPSKTVGSGGKIVAKKGGGKKGAYHRKTPETSRALLQLHDEAIATWTQAYGDIATGRIPQGEIAGYTDFLEGLMAKDKISSWSKARILKSLGHLDVAYKTRENRIKANQQQMKRRQDEFLKRLDAQYNPASEAAKGAAADGQPFPDGKAVVGKGQRSRVEAGFHEALSNADALFFLGPHIERTREQSIDEQFKQISEYQKQLALRENTSMEDGKDVVSNLRAATDLDYEGKQYPNFDPSVQCWAHQLQRHFKEATYVAFKEKRPRTEVLSDPESDDSGYTISGKIKTIWDQNIVHPRFLYPRDAAVGFSTTWEVEEWDEEKWQEKLARPFRTTGKLKDLEAIKAEQKKASEEKAKEVENPAEDQGGFFSDWFSSPPEDANAKRDGKSTYPEAATRAEKLKTNRKHGRHSPNSKIGPPEQTKFGTAGIGVGIGGDQHLVMDGPMAGMSMEELLTAANTGSGEIDFERAMLFRELNKSLHKMEDKVHDLAVTNSLQGYSGKNVLMQYVTGRAGFEQDALRRRQAHESFAQHASGHHPYDDHGDIDSYMVGNQGQWMGIEPHDQTNPIVDRLYRDSERLERLLAEHDNEPPDAEAAKHLAEIEKRMQILHRDYEARAVDKRHAAKHPKAHVVKATSVTDPGTVKIASIGPARRRNSVPKASLDFI